MGTKYVALIILFLSIFSSISNACSQTEIDALNTFYTVTSPWSGGLPSSWDPINDCCIREYIGCNENGSVAQIIMGEYQIPNNEYTIDFTGLPNLLVLDLRFNPFTLIDILLPSNISVVFLAGINLNNFVGNLFLPSITSLYITSYISEATLNFGDVPMPNLISIIVENVPSIGFVATGLPVLQSLTLTYNGDFTTFMPDLCEIKSLTYLSFEADGGLYYDGQFPECLNSLPLTDLSISNLYFNSTFPTLNDSIITFYTSNQNFITLPETLPKNIQEFNCPSCFVLPGYLNYSIPSGWENSTDLRVLNIENNYFNGTIPLFLAKRLDTFMGSDNYFGGGIEFLSAIKNFSFWELRSNLLCGSFPDLQYKVYENYIDLTYNYIYGYLERAVYCNLEMYLYPAGLMKERNNVPRLKQNGIKLLNIETIDPPEYYRDNYQVTLVTNIYDDTFYDILFPMENYCNTNYNDPSFIYFISPSPRNGGKINITSPVFTFFELNLPSLAKPKKFKSDQSNLLFEGSSSSIDENWVFEYFSQNRGNISIRTTGNEFIKLDCRIVSLNGLVECIVPEYNGTYFEYYFTSADTGNDFFVGNYTPIDVPFIDDIINQENSNILEIIGDNFGEESRYFPAIVQLQPNSEVDTEVLDCPVLKRNNTYIQCKKPKIKKGGNTDYLVNIQIGDQTSTGSQYLQFSEGNVWYPSNCYGAGDLPCQGRGNCTENGFCLCNNGFSGIFCEIKDSTVSLTSGTGGNKTAPTGSFEDLKSTSRFQVSIIEVRELNFRSTLVKKFTPTWKLLSTSNNGNQFTYSATLQSNSLINVVLTIYSQPTDVEFANTTIKSDTGSIKYTVSLNGYPFQSKTNSLEVVFQVDALPSQKAVENCDVETVGNSETTNDPSIGDIKWLQMNRGNSQILARIINRCELDDRIVYIKYHHEQITSNQVNIVASIPYFEVSSVIDPNYSVLLKTQDDSPPVSNESKCDSSIKSNTNQKENNDWKIATGVVIAGVVAIAAGIGGYIYFKKKKGETKFQKQMKALNKS